MNYGPLIRKARQYRKWTLQDLADELGNQGIEIDTGNLSRVETGKQGTSNHILDGILQAFGISIEALLQKASGLSEEENTAPLSTTVAKCPVISWEQVASWQAQRMGQPITDRSALFEEWRVKEWQVEEWLICPIPHDAETYAVRISGESMQDPHSPISFYEGDIVFFDPEKDAKNNSFVAARESGKSDVTFKQLIIEGNRTYLKANNPDWPDRITPVKDDSLMIYGVAIGKFRCPI